MENEKIIKPENENEFVRIFRQLTASGVLDSDKAITKILRDFPHFFRVPDEDDIARDFRDELNSEIRQRARAGVQSNRIADRIFRG